MNEFEIRNWVRGQVMAYLEQTGKMYCTYDEVRDTMCNLADDVGVDELRVRDAFPGGHIFEAN